MSRRHVRTPKKAKPPEVALLDRVARRFEAELARLEATEAWKDWTAPQRLAELRSKRQPEYVESRLQTHRWLDVLERYAPLNEWPKPEDADAERRDRARQIVVKRREAYAIGSRTPVHSAERQRLARIVEECDAELLNGLLDFVDLEPNDGDGLEVGVIPWLSDADIGVRTSSGRRKVFLGL